MNAYATEWSREYAGEQHGSKRGKHRHHQEPIPSGARQRGEALLGESRLIAATRRRLEALCRAFRQYIARQEALLARVRARYADDPFFELAIAEAEELNRGYRIDMTGVGHDDAPENA